MTNEEKRILARQVDDWSKELQRLVGQIASAKGQACAVVMITARSQEGYEDVTPELITEDAFRVSNFGWPAGFDVEVLNPSA